MSAPVLASPPGDLAFTIPGIWWLESRIDWTKDGQRKIDPVLGSDPMGILSYAKNHFSAQFMKKDRSGNNPIPVAHSGANNTAAVDGYDAYFGTYEVNEETGKVSHTLLGSITPANVGITVSRDLRVNENQLIIQLETTTIEGEPLVRTLTWKRIS